jgi:hypothetical protein
MNQSTPVPTSIEILFDFIKKEGVNNQRLNISK